VLTWAELERAAPDITARGRELLERFQFVFVGTLTKNGSPRVNPCEAYVIDGHLLLNMMPRSLKALDLLRDPRIYVHTPVTSTEAGEGGEFKLAGRAPVLEDAGLRRKLDDLFWQMIQWAPCSGLSLFRGARGTHRVPQVWRGRNRPSMASNPLSRPSIKGHSRTLAY
jgi:hypothetical protein